MIVCAAKIRILRKKLLDVTFHMINVLPTLNQIQKRPMIYPVQQVWTSPIYVNYSRIKGQAGVSWWSSTQHRTFTSLMQNIRKWWKFPSLQFLKFEEFFNKRGVYQKKEKLTSKIMTDQLMPLVLIMFFRIFSSHLYCGNGYSHLKCG